ncbi:threonine/serine dehydratase [Pseudaestuariivita sp.]|uniref:threonine/serine dehydratase n=1 Tax=Pseudaestuariivita sp. TaxID=2211669 RepID=UPI0040595C0C
MVTPDDISAAAARIAGHVRRTPVVEGIGGAVSLKLEHLQHTGSFKPRGAFNTLLSGGVPKAGVVAASGGNHGAAVAYAAKSLGIQAHIFVPEIAGPSKIALIERTGAKLTVVPGAYANALEAAQSYEAETGAMQVHAYDAPGTVAGQGTMMAEWEEQGLDADTVLIAVGGGGLIAGALAWLGGRRKVVAVESTGTATLYNARKEGPESTIQPQGAAANALGAAKIGRIAYNLAERDDVQTVLVDDDAIGAAQTLLWQEVRQLVEPAGATALAALTSGAYQPEPDERVAVLVCGGNIAPDPLS